MKKKQKSYGFLMIILMTLLSVGIASAQDNNQQPQAPCSQPEAAQFDFWLGEWELTWPGGQAGTPADQQGKGSNKIEKLLGSCVVQENFSTGDGSFIGKSWSVYNARTKQWQQTWVDNSGGYLLFTGSYENGKMELRTAAVERAGKTFVSRMVFENINENTLDWNWQRSDDGGETWQDVWNIRYTRKKQS